MSNDPVRGGADLAQALPVARAVSPVLSLLSDTAELAEQLKRPDLVARLGAERRQLTGRHQLNVVVAAETKRGKSSLINALVGHEGLMPVDVDVTTGVQVAVLHGSEVGARVFLETEAMPTVIAVKDLADWVTTWGNPFNQRMVKLVEVTVPSPLLVGGVVLVDTPGVGGLDAAHGRLTLATLSTADALLFVLDALAPITEPELAFLQHAILRIDLVVIALTKTALVPGWRDVLAQDRALIDARLPRLADVSIHPVDAPLMLAAVAGSPGAPHLDTLLALSGRQDLVDALIIPLGRRQRHIRLSNGLRAVLSVLEEIDQLIAVASPPAGGDSLETRRAAATAAEQATLLDAAAETALRRVPIEFSLARERVLESLDLDLARLRERLAVQLMTNKEIEQVDGQLAIELDAIAREATVRTVQELKHAADCAFSDVGPVEDDEHLAVEAAVRLAGRTGSQPAPPRGGLGLAAAVGAASSVSQSVNRPLNRASSSHTQLAGLVALDPTGIAALIGIGLASLSALLGLWGKKQKLDRDQVSARVNSVIREWQARVKTELSAAIAQVQRDADNQIRDLRRRRTSAARALLTQLEAEVKKSSDAGQQRAIVVRYSTRAEILRRQAESLASELAQLVGESPAL